MNITSENRLMCREEILRNKIQKLYDDIVGKPKDKKAKKRKDDLIGSLCEKCDCKIYTWKKFVRYEETI